MYLCTAFAKDRNVAQLVAHYVRDVGVGRSSRLIPTENGSFSAPIFCRNEALPPFSLLRKRAPYSRLAALRVRGLTRNLVRANTFTACFLLFMIFAAVGAFKFPVALGALGLAVLFLAGTEQLADSLRQAARESGVTIHLFVFF